MNEEVCSRESLEQANGVLIQNIMWIHESVETQIQVKDQYLWILLGQVKAYKSFGSMTDISD